MTDKQREQFEAWAVANEMTASGDREDRLDYPLGRCLWKAWQAATAAERERWTLQARLMHQAADRYGCGFYGEDDWIAAYEELRRMAGMDQAG